VITQFRGEKDAGTCPPWCIDCDREAASDGYVTHRGASYATTTYTEGCGPVPLAIRVTHFDRDPESELTPHPDLDAPMIDVIVRDSVPAEGEIAALRLTPAQARRLAELLATLVDTVEAADAP